MTPFIIRFIASLLPVSMLAGNTAMAGDYAVFKSTDRGRSWFRADAGMPGDSRINAFGSLDETLFAGTDSGIFLSEDEARNWRPATGVAMLSGRVVSFATLGRKVFAGVDDNGLLVTADKGASWKPSATFRPGKARCLLAHNGALYVGTDNDGVSATYDSGQTWVALPAGLPAHAQVFAMSVVEGRLFAGLYSKGLYRWDGKEQRWAKVGPVSPLVLAAAGGTLVAGHNPGGFYWSADLGVSWSKSNTGTIGRFALVLADKSESPPPDAPVWELASNNDQIFAGASSGIYYSDDRGRSWVRARTGLPSTSPAVSFLLKRSFVLAAASISASQPTPSARTGGGFRIGSGERKASASPKAGGTNHKAFDPSNPARPTVASTPLAAPPLKVGSRDVGQRRRCR